MINSKAREITADSHSEMQASVDNALRDLHTALPAIVISYDPQTRTVKAQPAIQRLFRAGDGYEAVNLPPCVDVPVYFPSGGGFEITFPVKEGDECLLIFAERCIDGWYETGQPSPPADNRKHDLSDGFALVGISSKSNASATSSGLSIGSKSSNIAITEDSVLIKKGNAELELTEDKLSCNVEIHCKNVITDKIDVNEHMHQISGGGTTLEPF